MWARLNGSCNCLVIHLIGIHMALCMVQTQLCFHGPGALQKAAGWLSYGCGKGDSSRCHLKIYIHKQSIVWTHLTECMFCWILQSFWAEVLCLFAKLIYYGEKPIIIVYKLTLYTNINDILTKILTKQHLIIKTIIENNDHLKSITVFTKILRSITVFNIDHKLLNGKRKWVTLKIMIDRISILTIIVHLVLIRTQKMYSASICMQWRWMTTLYEILKTVFGKVMALCEISKEKGQRESTFSFRSYQEYLWHVAV